MIAYANTRYQQALDYLYGFINFEKTPIDRYHISKMDTSRTGQMLKLLGRPQEQYPTIHIAGTKGKGSVAAMCAAVLRAAGLRVGLYTSPHLREFRERIRVLTPDDPDGRISEDAVVDEVERLKTAVDALPPQPPDNSSGVTWFEAMTTMAFCHFAARQVDIAVVEVGLGGRLDATNVLEPLVSVITSLSLDHTRFLGDTLTDIAYEKGGIIKRDIPLVSAPQRPEALAELERLTAERGTTLTLVGRDWQFTAANHRLTISRSPDPLFVPDSTIFEIALAGLHQVENAAVALATLAAVRQALPQLDLAALRTGLATTVWPGRLDVIHRSDAGPTFLVDAAHNPDSAAKLAQALQNDFTFERLVFIFGAPSDKSIPAMMQALFPLADRIIMAAADHPRAARPAELVTQAAELGFTAVAAPDLVAALTLAFAGAGPADLICATGSIIFVGNLLIQWDSLQSRLLAA